jgi:hypothetical protein
VAGDDQRREDRHCFVVAAERVAAGDRGVDELAVAEPGHEVRERERQAGTVGHDVGDAGLGPNRPDRHRDRRELAVQRRGDDGHPPDRLRLGQRLEVLLGAADVGLEAGVPTLDDVAGTPLTPFVTREVPVHDVPAAGSEPELDGGGVHDDVVERIDAARQLREHVGALGAVAQVDLHALQSGPLLQQARHRPRAERRHPGGRGPGARATRSGARRVRRAP